MKKYYRGALAAAVLILAACVVAQGAQADEIETLARSGRAIKVFVNPVANESGQAQADQESFRKEIEKAFSTRRSVIFTLAKNAADSDVVVSGIIKGFKYLERGPLKPTPSIAVTALDAMATATMNYVEMTVEFEIVDARTSRTIWKDTISRYIKQEMSLANSVPLIYDKIARAFVSKSFGKGQ